VWTCSYLRYVLPVGVLFSIVLWLSNAVYLYLSVSFIQMLKASMPVAVFVVGIALRTTQYSHRTAMIMAWVGFGIALASFGEINFVWIGVIYQMISIFCESFRLTLIQVSWPGSLHTETSIASCQRLPLCIPMLSNGSLCTRC
jgi:Triose-phosphate Transporter family